MALIGKFVYMSHHFILLWLYSFGLTVDREGWWFAHSLSQLRVSLSAEGAINVSWFWPSCLQGWGSLNMASTCKFVYMADHFILLQLNPFGHKVDREGWWFEHSLYICGFACQQRVLKKFPGHGYLGYKDRLV